MQFQGTYEFAAPAELVFDALTNPSAVAGCIPGCEGLDPLGNDRYQATMALGIGAIKGKFQGTVALREQIRPASFVLQVAGRGSAGFANGEARIEISESDTGSSVTVRVNAKVGGAVARVGQRLLIGTAKTITGKFFACLREHVETGTANPST